MQSGHKRKTDGRGMRQYNYGQFAVPHNGGDPVSKARRAVDKEEIKEGVKETLSEEKE